MKKLMFVAAIATAMVASANTCVTTKIVTKDPCTGEKTTEVVTGAGTAHKVAISLKTTDVKGKTTKKACEDAECTFWYQQATKKINGLIWAQLDGCNDCTADFDGQSVALWTSTDPVDAELSIAVGRIGKPDSKGTSTKIEAYGTLAGDDFGFLAWGGFGTLTSKTTKNACEDDDCTEYVKSISGGIAGCLVKPEWLNECQDCEPVEYEGCCDELVTEYTAAYGTIKISYDTATAKKVAVADDADDIASFVKLPAVVAEDVIVSDVVIEE